MEQIGAKILVWVCPLLGSQLDYLIHYESKIDDLKKKVEELEVARVRVKHDVETAIRDGKKIEADVERWLTKYDKIKQWQEKSLKMIKDQQR